MAKDKARAARTPAELAEKGPAEQPQHDPMRPFDISNVDLLLSAIIEDLLTLILWLSQISPDRPAAREAAGRLDATRRALQRRGGVEVTPFADPRKRWLHEYPDEEEY